MTYKTTMSPGDIFYLMFLMLLHSISVNWTIHGMHQTLTKSQGQTQTTIIEAVSSLERTLIRTQSETQSTIIRVN